MEDSAYELDAFIQENGQTRPFSLVISKPTPSNDGGDFFCNVHAPELFKKDKAIHGVDAKQAEELAINFAKTLLLGKRLVDKKGHPISI